MKHALVLGGGGFIGSHMVNRLKSEGYWVRAVDLKYPEFSETSADEFIQGDLRDLSLLKNLVNINHKFFSLNPNDQSIDTFDEIYQFAADMGGAGFIFTGDNDAEIMHNSAQINLNLLESVTAINKLCNKNVTKIFYSSSACIYPEHKQEETDNPGLKESDAYPANPDSEYGWEKLFSERLYLTYARNHGLEIRIGRYHNIYGPDGTWDGGREKAPAAICRKVSYAGSDGEVECWGDGEQTRSFLYIDDCIEATRRLMDSDCSQVINIGSEEMVTINQLIEYASKAAGFEVQVKHIDGPLGVRGRNSQNDKIREILDWDYQISLEDGITRTYKWINDQISNS